VATSVSAAAPLLAGLLITAWGSPAAIMAFAASVVGSAVAATVSRGIRSMQPLPEVGELAIVGHRGSLAILRALITDETIPDAFAAGLALGCAIALVALGSASEAWPRANR